MALPCSPHFSALDGLPGRHRVNFMPWRLLHHSHPLFHVDTCLRPSLLGTGVELTLPRTPRTPTFQGVMLFCSGMRLAM